MEYYTTSQFQWRRVNVTKTYINLSAEFMVKNIHVAILKFLKIVRSDYTRCVKIIVLLCAHISGTHALFQGIIIVGCASGYVFKRVQFSGYRNNHLGIRIYSLIFYHLYYNYFNIIFIAINI